MPIAERVLKVASASRSQLGADVFAQALFPEAAGYFVVCHVLWRNWDQSKLGSPGA
jgi:hypothetical protein